MLYIKNLTTNEETSWYVGQKFPELKGRVMSFQADGDELDILLERLNPVKPILTIDVTNDCRPKN